MNMKKKIEIEFDLEEFEAAMLESFSFDRHSCPEDGGDIPTYLKKAEDLPPRWLRRALRPLVIDEAISPVDILIYMVDATSGRRYVYDICDFLMVDMVPLVECPPLRKDVENWVRSL